MPATNDQLSLITAVANAEVDRVRQMIEANADVNVCDEDGDTPLHVAVRLRHHKLIELLVEAGAKNVRNSAGVQPFDLAWEDPSTMAVMFKLFAKMHRLKEVTFELQGMEPIDLESLSRLACHDKDPGSFLRALDARDAMQIPGGAGSHDDDTWIRVFDGAILMKTNGSLPSVAFEPEQHICAALGDVAVLRELIGDNSELVDLPDRQGMTPLMWATATKNLEAVRLLLSMAASPNSADYHGNTPLHYAVVHTSRDAIPVLLEAGASNVTNHKGLRPFDIACRDGKIHCVRIMVHYYKTLRQLDQVKLLINGLPGKTSPLRLAINSGMTEVVAFLQDQGAPTLSCEGDAHPSQHPHWVPPEPVSSGVVDDEYFEVAPMLHFIARVGDMIGLTRLIHEDPDSVDVSGPGNQTALMVAVANQQCEAAELLLRAGTSMRAVDVNGATPLHFAVVRNKKREMIRLLLRSAPPYHVSPYCAPPHWYDVQGFRPFDLACMNGELEIVKMMLEDARQRIFSDQLVTYLLNGAADAPASPLRWAVEYGHVKVVEYLVAQGALVDPVRPEKTSPLQIAAGLAKLDIVKILVAKGKADITWSTSIIPAAHWFAVASGHLNVARYLIKAHRPVVRRQDIAKCFSGHKSITISMVKFMLEHETEEDGDEMTDDENDSSTSIPTFIPAENPVLVLSRYIVQLGEWLRTFIVTFAWQTMEKLGGKAASPLHMAALVGGVEHARHLLDTGAAPDIQDANGLSPLHLAVIHGHIGVVRVLVEHCATSLLMKCSRGLTPLHYAIYKKNVEIVRTLLIVKPLVDYNSCLWPPLVFACCCGNAEVLRLILQTVGTRGAQSLLTRTIRLVGSNGELIDCSTPLLCAVVSCHAAIVELILELVPEQVHWQSGAVLAPLLYAMNTGSPEVIEVLLRHNANVNVRDAHGRTPLHYAAAQGSIKIARQLIEARANVHNLDNDSMTPLDTALQTDQTELAVFLVTQGAVVLIYKGKQLDTSLAGNLLMKAAEVGDISSVYVLVADYAEHIDIQNEQGLTPLHHAVKRKDCDMVAFLLNHQASLDIEDNSGLTPFDASLRSGDSRLVIMVADCVIERSGLHAFQACVREAMKKLFSVLSFTFRKGCEFSLIIDSLFHLAHQRKLQIETLQQFVLYSQPRLAAPRTLLTFAIHAGHVNLLTEMVAPTTSRAELWEMLRVAAALGQVEVAQLLFRMGVHVDDDGHQSRYRLMHAAASCRTRQCIEILQLLRQHGADMNERGQDSSTPLHSAVKFVNWRAFEWLVTQGANLHLACESGYTPLHATILMSEEISQKLQFEIGLHKGMLFEQATLLRMAELLLDHGASVHSRSNKGETPLHLATGLQFQDFIDLLHQRGASVNALDNNRYTPLYKALSVANLDGATALKGLGAECRTPVFDVWPMSELMVLYGVAYDKWVHLDRIKAPRLLWFIDPSTVQPDNTHETTTAAASRIQVEDVTWLEAKAARIKCVTPKYADADANQLEEKRTFMHELRQWYTLNHPNILGLFGACHHPGKLFFVSERTTGVPLLVHLRNHPDQLWQRMYELGLALEYLHERDVAFERLSRDCIFLGTDGKVKLVGFGSASSDRRATKASVDAWRPQLDDPSFTCDVYALGKCIIEAISVCKRDDHLSRSKHTSLPVDERAKILDERMCCPDPRSRWKMPVVTQFLAALANHEAHNNSETSEAALTAATDNDMERKLDYARSLVMEVEEHASDELQDLAMRRLEQTLIVFKRPSAPDKTAILNKFISVLEIFRTQRQLHHSSAIESSIFAQAERYRVVP